MGLIAHYKLDDLTASVGPDLTYFNNSGKLVSTDGKLGAAYQRMGLNDGTDYLGTTEDIYLSSSFTMACWAYVTSAQTSANGLVTNHSHGANTGAGVTVKYISSTDFRISCNTGTGTSRTYHSYYGTSNIKDRWAHLLLRFDASTNNLSLWVDGVKEFETTYAMKCVPDKLQMFKWSTTYNRSAYLPGAILDDVRIYDHALSKREVKDLAKGLVLHLEANESEPKDKSLQGNNLINNGANYVDSAPVGKGAYTFNNATIDCGSGFHTTLDQTIAVWVKPYSFYARQNFYNRNYGGEGTITLEPSGYLNYYWGTNGGNASPYQGFSSTGGLTLNEWNHVVLVRKLGTGGYLKWYINGIERGSTTPAYTESAVSLSPLILGDGYVSPFDGQICDLRQYTTALSEADVKELYQCRASLDAQGNFYAGLFKQSPRARYIRDWLNGSTSNSSCHWVEIQAIDFNGVNVALGKPATSTILTDGNTATAPYHDLGSGLKSVQVDLGSVVELDYVHVWHYYGDGRTYYDTKTEISEDGIHWTTIFDSADNGTYKETSAGKIHKVLPPTSVGATQYGYKSGNLSELGITDGLVAYYPLTKDAKDYSGNDNHGVVSGATPVGGGFDGKGAYRFAQENQDFISISYDLRSTWTYSCWARHDQLTSFAFLGQGQGSTHQGLHIWFTSDNRLRFGIHGGDRDANNLPTNLNQWYHYVFVYDHSTFEKQIWRDGVRVDNADAHPPAQYTGTGQVRIGAIYSNTTTASHFASGDICNVKIFNRALSPEEIAVEYKRTGPTKMAVHNGVTYIQGEFKEVTV